MGADIQVVLKNDGGGSGIEPRLPIPPVLDPQGQTAFGLPTRKALVLKRDRKPGQATKLLGEDTNASGHVTGRTVEATWQAHHERGDAVFLRTQTRDLRSRRARGICLETSGPDHPHRPGERRGRIADRNPDAPRSDVEPDNTHVIIVSLFHDMTFRITLCITVFALGIGLRAQTPNGVSAEEEARRIADRIRGLQAESDRLAGEARTLLTDLRKLEAERNLQVERVRDAKVAIVEMQTAIEGTAQRLLALEAQRIAELPAMETQLVDMYKRGRSGFARLVLSAGGIREFGRATRAAAAMLRVSEERVTQHRATAQALGQERAKLEAELDARRAREGEARLAQAAADKAVADSAALLTRVDSQRDVNARLAGELQVEQARLTQQEADRVAAAALPAVSNAPATPSNAPALTFGPTGPPRGALLWPVSGRVTGRFGRRVTPTEDPAAANGMEITSREGNPVRTLHSGTVSFAGPLAGFGNLVIVDHGDNALSVYGYLGSLSVNRDDMVMSGAEIGRVGLAPAGTATLFLEIRIDGRSVDPIQWLRPL